MDALLMAKNEGHGFVCARNQGKHLSDSVGRGRSAMQMNPEASVVHLLHYVGRERPEWPDARSHCDDRYGSGLVVDD